MIPLEIVRHFRIAADNSCNLVQSLLRYMESYQCRGMQAERAGFKYRGYTPDNTRVLQIFHTANYLGLSNVQAIRNHFPWSGNEREVILQGIKNGQIGPIGLKFACYGTTSPGS